MRVFPLLLVLIAISGSLAVDALPSSSIGDDATAEEAKSSTSEVSEPAERNRTPLKGTDLQISGLTNVKEPQSSGPCYVLMYCDDGSTVECNGSSQETCSSTNPSLPSHCGFVKCGSTQDSCHVYDRMTPTGNCCSTTKAEQEIEVSCDNSSWQHAGYTRTGPCFDP